jgi:hypothetical protein
MLFGAGAGGKSTADIEVLGDEGDAESCKASQKESKESERCAVPLRIGLVALDAPAAPTCPEGSSLVGKDCVRKNVVTQVDCPAGTKWDGSKCAASVDTSCARGLHFEAGRGCVPDAMAAAPTPGTHAAPTPAPQVATTPTALAPTPATPSGPLLCGRFQLLDAGNGINYSGTGLVRDTRTGLTWARFLSEGGMNQAAASAYCSRQQMRLPAKGEAESIAGSNRCTQAWPDSWFTWTSPAAAGQAWYVLDDGRTYDRDVDFRAPLSGALCVR